MTDPDCPICRGRGIVHLPRHEKMSVLQGVGDIPESIALRPSSATFACPQCAGSVDEGRVAIFHSQSDMPAQAKDDPDHWQAIVTRHAHRLVDLINKRDFIWTREVRADRDDNTFNPRIGLRSTIGVVSKARVATIEQRALAAAEKIVEEAVAAAIKEVWNWGSYYNDPSIRKDDASRLISAGVKRVMDQHRERVKPNG